MADKLDLQALRNAREKIQSAEPNLAGEPKLQRPTLNLEGLRYARQKSLALPALEALSAVETRAELPLPPFPSGTPPDIRPQRVSFRGAGYTRTWDEGPQLRAAPEPTGFLRKAFGYSPPAKPPGWERASPIEKFTFATLPISDFLGRVGAKITEELGITKSEDKEKVLAGTLAEDISWYQKSPEAIGWGVEKIAEYKTLSGLFKLTGLHNVLSWAGQKLAQPFMARELATPAGQQAIKTLSRSGLKNLARNTIRSFLSAAPENIAFVSSWSAADALREGKALPEIQKSAIRGALWGGAFTAVGSAIGNVAATPEIKRAGQSALGYFVRKYPRLVDVLARDIEPEFVEASRQYISQQRGVDLRLIDLTAKQQAALRNMARIAKAEVQRQATREAQIKAYYQAAAKAEPAVTAIGKIAGVLPTGRPPTVPVSPIEPIVGRPVAEEPVTPLA